MSLTDLMSSMKLSVFPQIALAIFLVVFVTVILRTWSRRRRADMTQAAMLPLEED